MAVNKCNCTHDLANRLSDACKDQKQLNECAKRAMDGATSEPSPLPRSPLTATAPAGLASTPPKR